MSVAQGSGTSQGAPEPEHEQAETRRDGGQEWLQLAQLSADMGGDLARLMLLELRLALTSLNRMLLLALAFLPLILLVWLGLSLLPAVLVYQHSGSAAFGVLAFLGVQMLALGAVSVAWMRYRKALSLPNTRRQFRGFTGRTQGEPQVPET